MTRRFKNVERMIRRHGDYTDSNKAWKVLAKWDEMVPHFVKVLPKDYKRMQDYHRGGREAGAHRR
ncbi:MAG: hypothetical protein U5K69_29240 [Balneolaceae bacterium]|nr:hypothetical protein [Balneolaceae bacterium]